MTAMMPTRREWRQRIVRRKYGEIRAMADKYGRSYGSLWRWCKKNPHISTEELARRGPEDPVLSGRRGGYMRHGKDVKNDEF